MSIFLCLNQQSLFDFLIILTDDFILLSDNFSQNVEMYVFAESYVFTYIEFYVHLYISPTPHFLWTMPVLDYIYLVRLKYACSVLAPFDSII